MHPKDKHPTKNGFEGKKKVFTHERQGNDAEQYFSINRTSSSAYFSYSRNNKIFSRLNRKFNFRIVSMSMKSCIKTMR